MLFTEQSVSRALEAIWGEPCDPAHRRDERRRRAQSLRNWRSAGLISGVETEQEAIKAAIMLAFAQAGASFNVLRNIGAALDLTQILNIISFSRKSTPIALYISGCWRNGIFQQDSIAIEIKGAAESRGEKAAIIAAKDVPYLSCLRIDPIVLAILNAKENLGD